MLPLLIALACSRGGPDTGSAADTGAPPEPLVVAGERVALAAPLRGVFPVQRSVAGYLLAAPGVDLRVEVVRVGDPPALERAGLVAAYAVPGDTTSAGETDLWDHDVALFGEDLPADVGPAGFGLAGEMAPADLGWVALGVPLTPRDDAGGERSHKLARVDVSADGALAARTAPVAPVAWAPACGGCHGEGDGADDLLAAHDAAHGTGLAAARPARCDRCHGASAPDLAASLHRAHPGADCAGCHAPALRGVHAHAEGLSCPDCHGDPADASFAARPRCDDCHAKAGSAYVADGLPYARGVGHGGLSCTACHGPAHAVTPTSEPADNVQAEELQGYPGQISRCRLCHATHPGTALPHVPPG